MSASRETRYNDKRSTAVSGGLDYTVVDHYLRVARQMRAEAMADMVRKAFGALTRATHVAPAARRGTTHTA